jgi:hypothetical protein
MAKKEKKKFIPCICCGDKLLVTEEFPAVKQEVDAIGNILHAHIPAYVGVLHGNAWEQSCHYNSRFDCDIVRFAVCDRCMFEYLYDTKQKVRNVMDKDGATVDYSKDRFTLTSLDKDGNRYDVASSPKRERMEKLAERLGGKDDYEIVDLVKDANFKGGKK